MGVVVVGSGKGAPGATTAVLAVAAAWPGAEPVLIAELDADGGVLAARLGLGFEPGLLTLATALRRDDAAVDPHLQPIGDRVATLVAPSAAAQVDAALAIAGDRLPAALRARAGVVLVDGGRLSRPTASTDWLTTTDVVVLVMHPRVEDVAVMRDQVTDLQRRGVRPAVVLTGCGALRPAEVCAAIDAPLLGVVPHDPRSATALWTATVRPRTRRAPLLRATATIASRLAGQVSAATPSSRATAASTAGPAAGFAAAARGDLTMTTRRDDRSRA